MAVLDTKKIETNLLRLVEKGTKRIVYRKFQQVITEAEKTAQTIFIFMSQVIGKDGKPRYSGWPEWEPLSESTIIRKRGIRHWVYKGLLKSFLHTANPKRYLGLVNYRITKRKEGRRNVYSLRLKFFSLYDKYEGNNLPQEIWFRFFGRLRRSKRPGRKPSNYFNEAKRPLLDPAIAFYIQKRIPRAINRAMKGK